jgi:formylglycine-generating enzyme required for sulfatase activity
MTVKQPAKIGVKAEMIIEALKQYGYLVWVDKNNINPGKNYDLAIEKALDNAKCVVVLWSRKSVVSDWVKDEADKGKKKEILVPVLIDEVGIPMGFGRIQTASLVDWKGTLPNPEFDKILNAVANYVGRQPKPEPEKPMVDIIKEKSTYKKLPIVVVLGILVFLFVHYYPPDPIIHPPNITNKFGMEFVLISAKEFEMGPPLNYEGGESEGSIRIVNLTKDFYMGKTEVTQKQWRKVMGTNSTSIFQGDDLPVENVSWDEVQIFIDRLNENDRPYNYRLPSEAEWEYAARAGNKTYYSFGDDESKLGDYAWYIDNSDGTHAVNTSKPNPWGLYDMHGNVWEWVQDIYHISYNGAPPDGRAWEEDGFERVARGGAWNSSAMYLRSTSRGNGDPSYFKDSALGFRILRDL